MSRRFAAVLTVAAVVAAAAGAGPGLSRAVSAAPSTQAVLAAAEAGWVAGSDEVAPAEGVRTPAAVVTPDLRTIALWVDYPSIRASVRPRGGTFGEPFELDAGNANYVPQWLDAVALPDGEVLAVWSAPNDTEMKVKSLLPDGTISDARPVEIGGSFPAIAANDAGMVAVAYMYFNQVYLVIRPAGASSFGAPILLTTLGTNEKAGSLGNEAWAALDVTVRADGQVAVSIGTSIANPPGGAARMLIARYAGGAPIVETVDSRTLTLTPAPGTTNTAEFRSEIELLPDGRQLLVYGLLTRTNNTHFRELRGGPRNGTSQPAPPEIVPGEFGSSLGAKQHGLTLDDSGRPWVWWRHGTATGDELRVRPATSAGLFSAAPQTVATPFDTASLAAFGAGRTGLLFSQGGAVKASTSEDGGVFGPPVVVATPGQLPLPLLGGTFALAGAGEGSAIALWPVGGTVQAAALHATAFDATPPTFQSVEAPSAPLTAGVSGTFTASAADDWSVPELSWAFSDGAQVAGSTVQHAFSAAGTFEATARATDAVGNVVTATRAVTVVAAPVDPTVGPTVSPTGDPTLTPSPTDTPTVIQTVPNDFGIGKPKLNKKRGTAKVVVTLPGPGKLVVSGKGVAKQSYSPMFAGAVKVLVKAKGRSATTLTSTGKVRLKVKLTYTPTGGVAKLKATRVTLKKRLG